MTFLKIGICGATGKMGQAIEQILIHDQQFKNIQLVAKFARYDGIDILDDLCKVSEVIIDFSSPDVLNQLLESAVKHQNSIVIGTTALTTQHHKALKEASKKIAILYSANMSVGANIVAEVAAQVAKNLVQQNIYNEYDSLIIDKHHRFKKDSPSGTALMIADKIDKTLEALAYQKHEDDNECEKDKNKFISIKAGGIFGEHEVIFAGLDEVITIKHQALSRACFAKNALRAAMWMRDKPAGLYKINDLFCGITN